MFNSDDYHWALANAIIRGIGFAPLNAVLFGFCGDAVEFGTSGKRASDRKG